MPAVPKRFAPILANVLAVLPLTACIAAAVAAAGCCRNGGAALRSEAPSGVAEAQQGISPELRRAIGTIADPRAGRTAVHEAYYRVLVLPAAEPPATWV